MLTLGPKVNPARLSPEIESLAIPVYKQWIVSSGIDIAGQLLGVAYPDSSLFVTFLFLKGSP